MLVCLLKLTSILQLFDLHSEVIYWQLHVCMSPCSAIFSLETELHPNILEHILDEGSSYALELSSPTSVSTLITTEMSVYS